MSVEVVLREARARCELGEGAQEVTVRDPQDNAGRCESPWEGVQPQGEPSWPPCRMLGP
jgi:hypothetical protein